MVVFIIEEDVNWEGSYFHSVHASVEGARAEVTRLVSLREGSTYVREGDSWVGPHERINIIPTEVLP